MGSRAIDDATGAQATVMTKLQSPEVVPQAGAWAGFCSNGLLGERLGSGITAHGAGGLGSGVEVRRRHGWVLAPLARTLKRLSFYEGEAKVVQRRRYD